MLQLFLLIILGIDWASGYAIAGYCMMHGVNPYGYAFWQSFGPMLLLLIIQSFMFKNVAFNKRSIIYIILSGISGIAIPNLLIYLAAGHVPSGILTLLANTSPILIYTLALLYHEERFSLIRSGAVLIGVAGVMLIVGANKLQLDVDLGGWWLLTALFIPCGYAFCAVYIAKFRPAKGNSLSYAWGMLVVATLFNTPLVYLTHGFYPLQVNDFNSWLIALEILLSGFGYVLLFIVLKMVGAVYYTLVNIVTALTGIIYGYFIFGQHYQKSIYIAIAMIILTLVGLTLTQQKRAKN